MKSSKYNLFWEVEDGKVLAFNSMSKGVAILTPEDYSEIQRILSSPDEYQYNTHKKRELKRKLIKGRFLIDENVDEMKILRFRFNSVMYNADTFSLTVCPTLNCNMRCSYCYQSGFECVEQLQRSHNLVMSDEVKRRLVKLVEKKTKQARKFRLIWYGGEPLLALDTVAGLGRKFKEICEKNECKYEASIVTNGYLLTENVAERLRDSGVTSAEVILDGPPEVHDRRRPLKNGKGTFGTIFNNIKASSKIIEVILRINIDKTNIHSAGDLF